MPEFPLFCSLDHEESAWAVVRPEDLVPDHIVRDISVHEPLGHDEVVQPPAHVLGPAVHHVGPEGVGILPVGVEVAEAVHQVTLLQSQLDAC